MDKRNALILAKRYLHSLKTSKLEFEKAYLFGSSISSENNSDSDVDLAIVFKEISNRFDVQVELLNLRSDDQIDIEPHPFRVEDFNLENRFANEIITNGILIS